MTRSMIPGLAVAALASLCALASPPANASFESTNASGTCQGALPAFAGTLRARPLALGNEGGSAAFATCSIPSGSAGTTSKAITEAYAYVTNSGSSTATVTCTLVDGYSDEASYLPKSATLAAGSSTLLQWSSTELPGAPTKFKSPNFSCSLPPGTAIYWIGHSFTAPTS